MLEVLVLSAWGALFSNLSAAMLAFPPFGVYSFLALQLRVTLLSKEEVIRSVTLLIPHI